MTELSFLIELLLNHELPKPTKDLIAGRIREVESGFQAQSVSVIQTTGYAAPTVQSTWQTLHQRENTVQPVKEIAQTPAAQQAINDRNVILANAQSGHNLNKITGTPNKMRGELRPPPK